VYKVLKKRWGEGGEKREVREGGRGGKRAVICMGVEGGDLR
jgi:hypothetical protein